MQPSISWHNPTGVVKSGQAMARSRPFRTPATACEIPDQIFMPVADAVADDLTGLDAAAMAFITKLPRFKGKEPGRLFFGVGEFSARRPCALKTGHCFCDDRFDQRAQYLWIKKEAHGATVSVGGIRGAFGVPICVHAGIQDSQASLSAARVNGAIQ